MAAIAASACGPAPEPQNVLTAPVIVAPPPPLESPSARAVTSAPLPPPVVEAQCEIDRRALWGSYRRSQERPCATQAECVVVITPNSFERELATVAHRDDAPRLEQDARALIGRCGAFSRYQPTNAIRVVEPACIDRHCAERETVMHVED